MGFFGYLWSVFANPFGGCFRIWRCSIVWNEAKKVVIFTGHRVRERWKRWSAHFNPCINSYVFSFISQTRRNYYVYSKSKYTIRKMFKIEILILFLSSRMEVKQIHQFNSERCWNTKNPAFETDGLAHL